MTRKKKYTTKKTTTYTTTFATTTEEPTTEEYTTRYETEVPDDGIENVYAPDSEVKGNHRLLKF